MDLQEAYNIGIELMQKHGLHDWKLDMSQRNLKFGYHGLCEKGNKTIKTSERLVESNSLEWFLELMHHEIAHALVPYETQEVVVGRNAIWTDSSGNRVNPPKTLKSIHHGALWKAKMREFGYDPKRCGKEPTNRGLPDKYYAICPTCAKVFRNTRRPSKPYYCFCYRKFGQMDERSKLTYHDIEKLMPETRKIMGL